MTTPAARPAARPVPEPLTYEEQREKVRARNRAQYERDQAARAAARAVQRTPLEIWRPAFEGGQGLLPVDYGTAELVRTEREQEQCSK